MTFLACACFAHDLAALDGLLLACWHAAMTGRLKVINRQWAIMVYMRVKRHHQWWTVRHDPHASMTMPMPPAFVACGTLAPTRPVHMVGRNITGLAADTPPWLTATHDRGAMLVDGVAGGRPHLLPCDAPCLTLLPRGRGARSQGVLHRVEVLGVKAAMRHRLA